MLSGKTLAPLARYWHTLRYLKPVQFYGRGLDCLCGLRLRVSMKRT